MTHTITARRLFTDIGVVEFPVLNITDGLITDIFSDPQALAHETETLTAAFFDIHTHGAMGHDVMQASPAELGEVQRFLAHHGVAHYLPTTVTASVDTTLRALEALANAIESPAPENEAIPVGIHLEGPFLSHAKRGVHPIADLQPPSIELFDRFHTAARGHIKLITIAPEPNAATSSGAPDLSHLEIGVSTESKSSALDLITHATAQGVRVSLGHSNATAAETVPAIAAGATSATHTYNAMRSMDHREPGILGTVLTDDRLYAELICDGVHVAPAMVRLWLRAKGLDRAILVTEDRAVLTNAPETLAGSILTMDAAVANLQTFTAVSLADATHLATHNPAAMLGIPALTRLAPGSPANLNRFDAANKLTATYLRGVKL